MGIKKITHRHHRLIMDFMIEGLDCLWVFVVLIFPSTKNTYDLKLKEVIDLFLENNERSMPYQWGYHTL